MTVARACSQSSFKSSRSVTKSVLNETLHDLSHDFSCELCKTLGALAKPVVSRSSAQIAV